MFNHGRALATALLLGAGLAAPAAHADDLRNAGERLQDRREIRQDTRGLADDRADLHRLSDLITEWGDARAANDRVTQARLERRIAAELRSDLRETAAQTDDAGREVHLDRREVRSEGRELRDAKVEGDAHDARQARRELRDDRRYRRDDRADAAKAAQILDQKRALAQQLRDLQREMNDRGEQEALRSRQGQLFDQYLALSRQEMEMGIRELREDRRDLREDRRETREDRRQRR